MITSCTDCLARYRLDSEKVPNRKIRVRCPSCRGVFVLDGTARGMEVEPVMSESRGSAWPAAASARPSPTVVAPVRRTPPPVPQARPAAAEFVMPSDPVGTAVMDQPQPVRRRRSKEEMLARALVSDIKVYNREIYEKAVAQGNLLDALGPEIKKSWELYKEKVTPQVAGSTDYFRDALNEILAEGRNVF